MGEGEVLLGPPTLEQEGGLPHGRLTAESVRCSLVCSVLMEGLTKLKFAILHSGATICNKDKSERSVYHMGSCKGYGKIKGKT